MRIHFIAIGGAAMHGLAVAMKRQGHLVTGSDDEIFDPARTQLANEGLLPVNSGWFPDIITSDIEAVILGMHAHSDNPELIKALKLGLKVYSYPEFLYESTFNKTRVVVAGSHGKTTITSMIMHVLRCNKMNFDYMVGSRVEGFDNMVNIEKNNEISIFEGDEYLSSTIDPRPKFHLYKPQIAIISGIAWDHINVFPTWEEYVKQFRIFAGQMPEKGHLIYCSDDTTLKDMIETAEIKADKEPYSTPNYLIEDGVFSIVSNGISYQMSVFGKHNMQNIEGARKICTLLNISDAKFYKAISTFKGAGKRLQLIGETDTSTVFLDFAHSPSKVEATVSAVKEQYNDRKIIACLELHTYSSLNKNFLSHYKNTLDKADDAIVFYNPETIKHKRLDSISIEEVKEAFKKNGLQVITQRDELETCLYGKEFNNSVLLLMSSGNFSGIDFNEFAKKLLEKKPNGK